MSSCFVVAVALASLGRAQTPVDASKAAAGSVAVPSAVTPPPPAALSGPASDDFNRPNAPTLGSNWLVQQGSFQINNNHGGSTSGVYPWVQHVSAGASYDTSTATIDFLPASGPSVIYVALIFGTGASTDNIFIKVQDNTSDGLYDSVWFYRGINGGTWGSTGYSFPLTTPTASGRMHCYFTSNGDVANCDIDIDFNGTIEDHFQANNILAAGMNLGTSTGIGCYGLPEFDNWSFNGGTPVLNYCTSGTTTNGCVPVISGIGTPSASASSGFTLQCNSVEGVKQGIVFYGISGQVGFPWGTSTSWFCVKTPTQRLPTQNSGGTLGQCNGQLSIDLLAYIAANPGSLGAPFSAGNQVFAQGWFRDPPSPKSTMMTDALQVTLGP
jgi:hypothetical protein